MNVFLFQFSVSFLFGETELRIYVESYSTGYDERMHTRNVFIILNDIATCRVLEATLLVIFGPKPCEAKAVRTVDNRFIIIVRLQNLTRTTNCRK